MSKSDAHSLRFTLRLDPLTHTRLIALRDNLEQDVGPLNQATVIRMAISTLASARGVVINKAA